MKIFSLQDMKGGWFIGDFEPSCYRAKAFEIGAKQYKKGDSEPEHVHRIATEVTLILSGRAAMNGRELTSGDIVLLEPGEAALFDALEDTVTLVAKFPSVPSDKYLTGKN